MKRSWINIEPDSDFTIHNIPFGICRKGEGGSGVCSIIGDQVIDLQDLQSYGLMLVDG
jgi:fumarylacetoacetase